MLDALEALIHNEQEMFKAAAYSLRPRRSADSGPRTPAPSSVACAAFMTPPITCVTSALVADGKIVVCGDPETDFIAEAFRRQLTYRYEIERPGLPCIRLDADLVDPVVEIEVVDVE